jgi:hypothetical protein
MRVLRNRLTERTRAKAFGRPSREENPAARMRTVKPGRVTEFIGSIIFA